MIALLAPAALALGTGLMLTGSASGLFSNGIRGWSAILAAFAVELILYNPPVDGQAWAITFGPAIWLATKIVLLALALHNAALARDWLRWPWLVGAAGLAMNTLAIAANGGHMPQSIEAATAVWGGTRIDAARLQNIVAMGPDTSLPWLGDVLAEPSWIPRPNVISPGDVLLSIGVAGWVFAATLRAHRAEPAPVARIMSVIGTPIYGLRGSRRRRSG